MTFHIYLSYFGQSSLSFEVAAKKKNPDLDIFQCILLSFFISFFRGRKKGNLLPFSNSSTS